MKVVHTLKPIINRECNILILGSFPSVKSRENNFYYMHPQNRFWKVLSHIFKEDFNNASNIEKEKLCLKHKIAIYDVIYSCDIKGSSDSSIENVIPSNIKALVKNKNIKYIYCNGAKAYNLFKKHNSDINIPFIYLSSTSPANAQKKLDDLIEEWKIIKK